MCNSYPQCGNRNRRRLREFGGAPLTELTPLLHDSGGLALAAIISADQHPATVFIASLPSPHSKRNNTRYLGIMGDLLLPGRFMKPDKNAPKAKKEAYKNRCLLIDWGAVRFQHTAAIRAQLLGRYALGTVNVMLSALRGVLKVAWQLGQMSAEDYHRARAVQNVKGESLPSGRNLAQSEILALASICASDDRPQGVRDAVIIGLLYSCGLRRAELVALDVGHIDMGSGQIKVLRGKGRKDRTVYAANGAYAALRQWLAMRGDAPGAVFLPVNKRGEIIRKERSDGGLSGIGSQAAYNMLERRARQAGVADFSPHDFRRTFVGDLLDRGVDISTVQQLAGHANVTTTARYDRRPEEVKREGAKRLHFPWQAL